MAHKTSSPETTFCQNMSGQPSKVASPTVAIFQLGATNAGFVFADDGAGMPFKLQMRSAPVASLCQSASGCPSPVKSAVPRSFQFVSGIRPGLGIADSGTVVRLKYQTTIAPVAGF